MNWKLFSFFIFIGLLLVTGFIVWNNRSSDKLVSNFISVLFLGTIGLLITSIVSLKEEITSKLFGAVLFLEKTPISLPIYKYRLKSERTLPLVMTNQAIERIQSDSTKNSTLQRLISNNYSKFTEDLFIRYFFDLLVTRYRAHWYYETLEVKAPTVFISSSNPKEFTVEVKYINCDSLSILFPDNLFMKEGYAIDNGTKQLDNSGIMVPPNIIITSNPIINGL